MIMIGFCSSYRKWRPKKMYESMAVYVRVNKCSISYSHCPFWSTFLWKSGENGHDTFTDTMAYSDKATGDIFGDVKAHWKAQLKLWKACARSPGSTVTSNTSPTIKFLYLSSNNSDNMNWSSPDFLFNTRGMEQGLKNLLQRLPVHIYGSTLAIILSYTHNLHPLND